jgi:hypothetical protein
VTVLGFPRSEGNLLTVVWFLAQALFQALEPAFFPFPPGAAVPTSRGPIQI